MTRRCFWLMPLLLIGCGRSADTSLVPIGHLHHTGAEESKHGVDLAVEHINADSARHVASRKLKVIHADAGAAPDEAQGQATRLITLDKVDALIGGNRWGPVERLALAAQSPATVAVTCNGHAGVPFAPILFPIGAAPSEVGKTLARHCKEDRKFSKVIVLKEADAVVPGLIAKAFVEQFGSAVEHTIRANETPDFFKELKADAVVLCATARGALAWKTRLPAGIPLLFGGEEADIALLQGEIEATREILAVASFHADDATPTVREFVQRYQERYGKAPGLSAALSYDALMIWAEAARRANSAASDKVREQLAKKEATFATLTGSLWFETDQTPRRPLFVVRIANDGIKLEKRYEP